jgi:hypothetical protein
MWNTTQFHANFDRKSGFGKIPDLTEGAVIYDYSYFSLVPDLPILDISTLDCFPEYQSLLMLVLSCGAVLLLAIVLKAEPASGLGTSLRPLRPKLVTEPDIRDRNEEKPTVDLRYIHAPAGTRYVGLIVFTSLSPEVASTAPPSTILYDTVFIYDNNDKDSFSIGNLLYGQSHRVKVKLNGQPVWGLLPEFNAATAPYDSVKLTIDPA